MRMKIEELKIAAHNGVNKFTHAYNPDNSPAHREFMEDLQTHNLYTENEMLKDKCRKLEDVLTRVY